MFIEEGVKLLECCILPANVADITDHPIDADTFQEYKKHLEIQLPTLFDLISAKEADLLIDEMETLQFRTLLAEFLFEQCGSCDLFRTEKPNLRKNLSSLEEKIIKMITKQDDLYKKLFEVYKEKLSGQKWKKNLGSIYGLMRLCEVLHSGWENIPLKLDESMFILSIATQLIENSDPGFKFCGLKHFAALQDSMDAEDFDKMNFKEVIYSQCKDNIDKIKSSESTELLWKCIGFSISCEVINSRMLDWNKVDDSLESLLNKLRMESDPEIRSVLQQSLVNILIWTITDVEKLQQNPELNPFSSIPSEDRDLLKKAMKFRGDKDNLKTYRWIKALLDMMVFQLMSLTNSHEHDITIIQFIQTIYVMTISGVKPELVEQLLADFINRIMKICAEILKIYTNEENLIGAFKKEQLVLFLKTIYNQVPSSQNVYFKALGKFLSEL